MTRRDRDQVHEPQVLAIVGAKPLAYINRLGDTYYLHMGKTKTGKPRYFVAKKPGVDVVSTMPKGFEFSESINGVVSVRRLIEKLIPDADVAVVGNELERHEHLFAHRAEVRGTEVIIHAPDRGPMGSYSPVMKFALSKDGGWSAYRMTYRGKGGWWMIDSGPLFKLAKKLVRHIGTDEFFELI